MAARFDGASSAAGFSTMLTTRASSSSTNSGAMAPYRLISERGTSIPQITLRP